MKLVLVLWAIFNLVLAIMIIMGSTGAPIVLAWSIIIGWVVAFINGVIKS